jgi:hypothetical protein
MSVNMLSEKEAGLFPGLKSKSCNFAFYEFIELVDSILCYFLKDFLICFFCIYTSVFAGFRTHSSNNC